MTMYIDNEYKEQRKATGIRSKPGQIMIIYIFILSLIFCFRIQGFLGLFISAALRCSFNLLQYFLLFLT